MTTQALGAAAGWYPDGHGSIRFFDGSAWTEHTQPPAAPAAPQAQPAAQPQAAEPQEPFYRQGWFFVDIAVLGLIVAIIVIAAVT